MKNNVALGLTLIACLGGFSWYALRPPSEPSSARGDSRFQAGGAEAGLDPARIATSSARPLSVAVGLSQIPSAADIAEINGQTIADSFEALLARTRNNPGFAYALATALQHCSRADATYRSLEVRASKQTAAASQAALAEADEAFRKCKGLTSKQLEERSRLMEVAARAGVLEAQIEFRDIAEAALQDRSAIRQPGAMDALRAKVEAFTTAAAGSGDQRGLYAAYKFYSDGYFVQPDFVRAHSYATAFARLNPGLASQRTLAWLENQMTAEQLRRVRGRE